MVYRSSIKLACFGVLKASVCTCLALLAVVGAAPAQTGQRKPLPTEPLEKYDNPPAPYPLRRTGVSPGMISQYGPFTSRQVNVNASGMNITGDAANEPSIAVDPTNHSRMVIGWRQFDSVTSNFRQGGWGYTSNGGTTWTFPGVLESGVFRSDPVLGCDDTGRFLYLSLLQSFDVTLWRSLNGGQTFTNIAPATGGDKQWFVVDNTASTGHGFQYQFWDYATPFGTREFSRSTDGGFTWMDPINIPNSPQWGTPDVDSNGNLFFGGVSRSLTQFWCIRSTNAKNAAVTPSFDQSTAVNLGGVIDYQDTINPEGLIGQVFLAVDRSGTSTNNNVYMMASVQPTGFGTGSDVMFVRSTDGGQTFSAPKRVNDDPVNHSKWHWFGTLAVAPNGRIDSVWMDTRNAANNTDSQLFYSYSTDAGNTWSPNVAVSIAFNPFLGYPAQNKLGDYMTIVSDNTGGDVAYAATFNLEQDVYYVRVAPGTTPTPSPTATPTATATSTATATPTATATSTATATATASPTASVGGGGTPSPTATTTASPTPRTTPAAQALNFSTRMRVGTGDNVGIGGFIVTGNAPKRVLIRAIGPSLTQFGVPDALADPVVELHGPPVFITLTNDNWRDTQEAEIMATGIPPSNDLESAIVVTLNPDAYTAIVTGKNGTSGAALVEVYDLDLAAASQLGNVSTRALVGTGDNLVIAGFILGNGGGMDNVIARGIGPSLTGAGVANALADPTLQLRNSNGVLLMENNDWQEDAAQAAIIMAAGLAPSDSLESAIAATLPPGPYTALLAGRNAGTGIGVVEIYDRGSGGPGPTPTATATATATPAASPSPSAAPPFTENFDGVTAPALPAGWVASNPDPGDGVLWVTSTVTPDSAPNDAFIPDQSGVSDKVLDTPNIEITSSAAILSFRNNFNTEVSGGVFYDGGVLEVSSPNINGGAFLDVTDAAVGGFFLAGGYTGKVPTGFQSPITGRMAWSGNSGGYINTIVNLGPSVKGQTIKLRFRFVTDEAVAAPGWRIDSLSLTGGFRP